MDDRENTRTRRRDREPTEHYTITRDDEDTIRAEYADRRHALFVHMPESLQKEIYEKLSKRVDTGDGAGDYRHLARMLGINYSQFFVRTKTSEMTKFSASIMQTSVSVKQSLSLKRQTEVS